MKKCMVRFGIGGALAGGAFGGLQGAVVVGGANGIAAGIIVGNGVGINAGVGYAACMAGCETIP